MDHGSTDPSSIYRAEQRAQAQVQAQAGARARARRKPLILWSLLAIVVIGGLVALVVFVGRARYDRFACPTRTGVTVTTPVGGAPRTYPTKEEAVAAFVAGNPPQLNREAVPTEGWYEQGDYFVHDQPDGTFYRVEVTELGRGWFVSGEFAICHA